MPDVTYDISYNNLAQATRHRTYNGSGDLVNFSYAFDDNGNITDQTFDHRTSSPYNEYTYDNLDRLVRADYLSDPCDNEQFTLDDLGNRTNVNLRGGVDETYVVDETTNRYNTVGGNSLDYDACGNMTLDPNDYQYQYDFENRMIKITKNETTIAEFAYDALGRRIEQYDAVADTTTRYYYSDNWQVLCEKDGSENTQRWFVYGGYIDEVLIMIDAESNEYYYSHDHLYSPVALLDATGTVLERYEYDAYGKDTIWDSTFTNQRTTSDYNNLFGLTGCRLDVVDNGNHSLSYLRNRYLDCRTGRWLSHDPIGYQDGMNLYEYVASEPVSRTDSYGLAAYLPGTDPANPWDVYPPGWQPKRPDSKRKEVARVCCKVKRDTSIQFGLEAFHHTECWQKDIENPKGLTPMSACQCKYKDPYTVYEAHSGKCCWCEVYLRWNRFCSEKVGEFMR